MQDSRITSRELTQLASVSQSAVSRVFSGALASKLTAEKGGLAAKELSYQPNSLTRAVITGKSRIIGLVISYRDNLFYPEAPEQLSSGTPDQIAIESPLIVRGSTKALRKPS